VNVSESDTKNNGNSSKIIQIGIGMTVVIRVIIIIIKGALVVLLTNVQYQQLLSPFDYNSRSNILIRPECGIIG
jgi:hypothetical protein